MPDVREPARVAGKDWQLPQASSRERTLLARSEDRFQEGRFHIVQRHPAKVDRMCAKRIEDGPDQIVVGDSLAGALANCTSNLFIHYGFFLECLA